MCYIHINIYVILILILIYIYIVHPSAPLRSSQITLRLKRICGFKTGSKDPSDVLKRKRSKRKTCDTIDVR